jgi:hypothetical protein
VTAAAPQAAERLLAVCPDVAILLAVVALGKSILCSISLHPDSNVQRLDERQISREFAVLGRVTRNRGRSINLDISGVERRVTVICLKLTTSKPRLTRPSEISSAGMLSGRWRIIAFMSFSDLGKKE